MRIQHNIAALNSYRQLGTNNNAVSKNLEKLSSGYRINRAGDDAAGLAISEKMRAQITGLETAQKNALDGISLVQTAEGALTEVHSMLNRMTELATQSANGTYSSEVDRENLQKEVATLKDEIDRISKSTNFNGIKLLDGSIGGSAGLNYKVNNGVPTTTDLVETGLLDMPDVNKGYLAQGSAGATAEASFYIGDLQLTSTGTTAGDKGGNTIDINFTLGDVTIDIQIKSNTAGEGKAAEITEADIQTMLNGILSSNTTATTITGSVGSGTNACEYEVTVGGGNIKDDDLNNKYQITVADNKVKIQAKKLGDDYKIGNTFTINASYTADEDAMNTNLQTDLSNAGSGLVDIEMGDSTGLYIKGEDKVDATYEISSAKLVFDPAKLKDYHNKSFKFNGITYVLNDIKNQDGLDDDLENKVDGTNVVKIDFDSTKAGTEASSLVGAIAIQLNKDFATDKDFEVEITDNKTLVIKESAKKANAILDGTDTDITDFNNVLSTSGLEIGGGDGSKTIDVTNELNSGTWITINGKKYEFATSADLVGQGSTYVQFIKGDAAGNAQRLEAAINADLPGGATLNGTKITLSNDVTSVDAGSKGLSLQVGDTADSYQKVSVTVKKMDTESLGIENVNIATPEGAEKAIGQLRSAINQVSATRGDLGAVQNRLEHTINNLGVTTENITAAESRIRDTDMAEEMMAYTKNNILVQAAQAMLAQANTVPQGVLQLLG